MIYLLNGSADEEVNANLLVDKLKSAKPPASHLYFDYLPGEDHATILHQDLIDAFKLLAAGVAER